jgi:hypothetical protein
MSASKEIYYGTNTINAVLGLVHSTCISNLRGGIIAFVRGKEFDGMGLSRLRPLAAAFCWHASRGGMEGLSDATLEGSVSVIVTARSRGQGSNERAMSTKTERYSGSNEAATADELERRVPVLLRPPLQPSTRTALVR